VKTGLWLTSFTPDGSELAAKANSLVSRSGWWIAMSSPMIAPSLQPTSAAFWMWSWSISASTSDAIRS
jgi:hypothetical protein